MAARGVDALTDRELLSLLTEDEQSAEALLAAYGGSLARVGSEEAARLRMIGGLGLRRARMLLAAAELGRRITAARAAETDVVSSSDDVVRLFRRSSKRSRMKSAGPFTSPLRTGSSNASG